MSRDEAIELLISLLKAESEPEMSKAPVLEVVTPLLEGMGLEIHRHENDGNPFLYASKGQPIILLSGHLDTVTRGDNWEHGQGEVVGDRVFGRGSLDMKGPCVSMLLAAGSLMAKGHDVALSFTTDEEVGMLGAKALVERHPEISRIPLIIVCEPTGFKPAIEEKGIVQFRVSAYGRSAHASMPELGSNAIENLNFRLDKLLDSGFFGRSSKDEATINVGRISGGTLVNVIPEHAEAEVDIRFSAEYTNDEVFALAKQLMQLHDGLAEVELMHALPPVKSEVEKETLSAIESHLDAKAYSVPYGTEMVRFAELNRNVLVLGPGVPDLAHQVDECIDINDVLRAAKVYHDIGKMIAEK
jgi:succinyl-diaminopimelate desuccinylase